MTKSALQIARAAYQPKLPKALKGAVKAVAGAATQSVADQEATPLINIFSILVFSFTIVPEAFVILESTSSSILYFLAISTERLLRT